MDRKHLTSGSVSILSASSRRLVFWPFTALLFIGLTGCADDVESGDHNGTANSPDTGIVIDSASDSTSDAMTGSDSDSSIGDSETDSGIEGDENLPEITPKASSYKPLGNERFTAFVKKPEYMIIGCPYNNDTTANLFVVDPLAFNFDYTPQAEGDTDAAPSDVIYAGANDHFIAEPRQVATVASLDDDEQEEVVTISWSPSGGAGVVQLIDPSGPADATTFATSALTTDFGLSLDTTALHGYHITAANVDDDGFDELVIAGYLVGGDARIWVLDDSMHSFAVLHTFDSQGAFDGATGYQGHDLVRVAAGNVDDDLQDEIIIAHGVGGARLSWMVLDDQAAAFATLEEGMSTDIVLSEPANFELKTGDVDKDGMDEIVLAALTYTTTDQHTYQLSAFVLNIIDDQIGADLVSPDAPEDTGDGFATIISENHPYAMEYNTDTQVTPLLATLDVDGDGADEILARSVVFDDLQHLDEKGALVAAVDAGASSLLSLPLFTLSGTVAVGDVNGDTREDIIVMLRDGRIFTMGYETVRTYDSSTGEIQSEELVWRGLEDALDARGTALATQFNNAVIVAPNVDDDSTVLEPIADIDRFHTTYYSRNHIHSILVAPPCISGINCDDSSTSLATSSGQSFTAGAEVSVRAGVIVGFSQEVNVGLFASTTAFEFEAEVETVFEAAIYGSTSVSVTNTISDTVSGEEDLIVFSTIPYDRYRYVIVSHPDPAYVGTPLTVDVPGKPLTLAVGRSYYNEHNGNQLDIDSSIIPSTPGDITTYVGSAEKNALMAQAATADVSRVPLIDDGLWYLLSNVQAVGENGPAVLGGPEVNSIKSLEVELANSQVAGAAGTLSVDASAKACTGGVCAGVTGGISVGSSFESEWSQATTFVGEVASVFDATTFWENHYEWGVYAYRQTLTDDSNGVTHDFIVVNYWVDPL